jgi:hypothetical protein
VRCAEPVFPVGRFSEERELIALRARITRCAV